MSNIGRFIGNKFTFKDRSNFNKLFSYKKKEEKRWCKEHISNWGKNGSGSWWPQCLRAHQLKKGGLIIKMCQIGN